MAIEFNNSSTKITYAMPSPWIDLTTMSFSVHLQRQSGGEGNYGRIFQIETGAAGQQKVWGNDNGDVGWGMFFQDNRVTTDGIWSHAYPTNDVWTQYVLTYDNTSTSNDPIVYKDGTSVTVTERATPNGAEVTGDSVLIVGNRSNTQRTWDGYLAEFGIWNRILSAGEAAALGKGYSPLFFPRGLVMYIPMIGKNANEGDLMTGTIGTNSNTTAVPHPRIIYPQGSY